MRRWWHMSGLLLVVALLAACGSRPSTKAAAPSAPQSDPGVEPPAQGVVQHFASTKPVGARTAQAVAAQVAPFVWTKSPAAADVPDQLVTGRIAGQPFIARYVSAMPDEELRRPTLWLRFSAQPRPADGGFGLDDVNVNLELDREPAVGEWQRTLGTLLSPSHAAYYSAFGPATAADARRPVQPGSGHDWSCWLAIDELRGPVEPGGIDTVVGRIALCFDDGPHQSWIAGRFVAEGRAFVP